MSDPASGSQVAQSSPAEGRPNGSKVSHLQPGGEPLSNEQPTVITSQPPLSTPSHGDGLYGVRPDRLTAGTSLGSFELIEYVGGGGMGHVYRATDKALGREVALKVLSLEQAADGDTVLRFRNEARSAARLNHENIVHVYYAGEEQGLSYIAFEFIEGTNIRDLVRKNGPLSLAAALSYTLQIAEALAYASRQNVVHRDIKPSNVLITPDGRAKLIDMGLARLRGASEADDLTASGVTLGTFDYISPEQARDPRNADVRSDIYSLGCTLFFMLAGRPPFPEGTVLQKLLQHQGDEPPDVRQFRPDLPDELSAVLRRMMAKSPPQRYQEPARLIEALLVLLQQVGLQPAGPGQRMWVAARPSRTAMIHRHLPWIAPVAILMGSVLLLHFLSDGPDYQSMPLARSIVAVQKSAARERAVLPRTDPKAAARAAEVPPGAIETPPPANPAPSAGTPVGAAAPAPGAGEGITPAVQSDVAAAQDRGVVAPGWTAAKSAAKALAVAPSAGEISLAHSGRLAARDRPNQDPWIAPADVAPGTPAAGQTRVLVVDGRGQSGAYFTLKAACSAAASGDRIELCYSGRIEPETPITLANVELSICAGVGFRPAVSFRPTESDPIRYRRSMFSLIGSRITLQGVAVELSVPEDLPPDSWTLFDIDQAESLELKRCWLTIRNAAGGLATYHDAAFMRLKASPFAESLLEGSIEHPRVTVTLEDCVVRGEATVLRNEGMQPIQLDWRNGMLSTSEWFLSADGSDTYRPSYTTQISLDHVTAMIGRGLCQFNHTDYLPDRLASLRLSDNILLGSEASVLLEQNNVTDLGNARQRIAWAGDQNSYQGFNVFWSIWPRDFSTTSEQLDFLGWLGHWTPERERSAHGDLLPWKQLPPKRRAVHTHTPDDFVLDDGDPAVAAAANGERAGMRADRLTEPPPAPEFFLRNTGSAR